MKKKILLTLVGLVCALCCAFGLAACGGNDNEVTGFLIAKANEQPNGEEIIVNSTYGEKPNLGYKLYLSYKNGETKEVSLTDENLTVNYSYNAPEFSAATGGKIEKLPAAYLAGTYTIEYAYSAGKSNFQAYVHINVARSGSGAFRVSVQNSDWLVGEETPDVTLKNPKAGAVQFTTFVDIIQADDTDGEYSIYIIKKDAYVALTAAQKSDYDYINNLSDKLIYVPNEECELSVGEYMLVALVDATYNYSKIVTPAVAINVRDIKA